VLSDNEDKVRILCCQMQITCMIKNDSVFLMKIQTWTILWSAMMSSKNR